VNASMLQPHVTPVLAEGLQLYVDLMRATNKGRSSNRLRADATAHELQCPLPGGMKAFTTFIVLDGQEIAVRIFQPGGPVWRPGICYFHGGGFTFGSVESFDSVAAALAEHTGAVVASVQYRRLPENSYRCAQEDCYAALVWLVDHADDLGIDPSRVAIAGDSVGATLATISAAMAGERNGPRLVCQILLYGAFALQPDRDCYLASADPLLTPARIESFITMYNSRRDASFYAAPLALSDLSKLPPAIMLAAEHDPLREEGLEYANRLRASGVPVAWLVAPRMIHGFLRARKMCPAVDRQWVDLARKAREYL
jgi:acetyl esterase